MEPNDWLLAKDAAELLGCTTKTVYAYLSDGTLRGMAVQRSQRRALVRISRASVEALMAGNPEPVVKVVRTGKPGRPRYALG